MKKLRVVRCLFRIYILTAKQCEFKITMANEIVLISKTRIIYQAPSVPVITGRSLCGCLVAGAELHPLKKRSLAIWLT